MEYLITLIDQKRLTINSRVPYDTTRSIIIFGIGGHDIHTENNIWSEAIGDDIVIILKSMSELDDIIVKQNLIEVILPLLTKTDSNLYINIV